MEDNIHAKNVDVLDIYNEMYYRVLIISGFLLIEQIKLFTIQYFQTQRTILRLPGM